MNKAIFSTVIFCGSGGGLIVGAIDSGSTGPGSSSGLGYHILFSGTLYRVIVPLYTSSPGTGELNV